MAKSWFARRDHQCEHSVQEPAGLDGILIPPQRLKTTRIVTMPVLMVASAWVLHYAVGGAGGEPPANENREEKSNMTNETVIMLIEAKIQPQRRTELVEAARQYLPLVRAEPGVEAFYITARKDDPNTFVFYEIYRSQAALDFHLQQDFTKKFLATLKSAQIGDRVRTNLVELAPEGQTQSN
jgi:quinol monooxygenase YgiN